MRKFIPILNHKVSRILILVTLFFLNYIQAFNQKYDYVWATGYEGIIPNSGWGVSTLSFNESKIKIDYLFGRSDIWMGYSGSTICNNNGDLILMSDGCKIMDKRGVTIENGDSLNPGRSFDFNCLGNSKVYPVINGNFFISCPSWGEEYLLIHQDFVPNNTLQDVVSENLYFTKVTQQSNGSYKVVLKNVKINTGLVPITTLAAVEHPDGDKWWICYPAYGSNYFHYLLIGKDGILKRDSQAIGPNYYHGKIAYGYQTKFSPNGLIYITGRLGEGIFKYEFDRQIGRLSGLQVLHTKSDSTFVRGICFSPNNRFLYYTQDTTLYQADLLDLDSSRMIVKIAHVNKRTETGWPYIVGTMTLGPDCRIYVMPSSTVKRMHVIHNPNNKGLSCNFQVDAIEMPSRIAHSIPNIMTFRTTGNQQLCDSSIKFATSVTDLNFISSGLVIYPNPAYDYINIQIPEVESKIIQILITDLEGRIVYNNKLENSNLKNFKVNVQNWPNSIFELVIRADGKIVGSQSFVKIE